MDKKNTLVYVSRIDIIKAREENEKRRKAYEELIAKIAREKEKYSI